MEMVVAVAVGRDHRLIQRRGGVAFAGDLGGDSLKDLRRHLWLDQHRQFRLAQHVDEARRDDLAMGIDRLFARGSFQIANRRDVPRTDANVGRIPRRAGAIHHMPVHDHDVERLGRSGSRGTLCDDADRKLKGEEYECRGSPGSHGSAARCNG